MLEQELFHFSLYDHIFLLLNHQFDFLNTKEIFDKVVDFSDDGVTVVTFEVPVIHCTSCIWLLESL